MRHADPDLEVARIGGFVAEYDQVKGAPRGLLALDRGQDRAGGGLRIPLLALDGQQNPALGSSGQRLADLLFGLRRAQSQYGRLAALSLDYSHRLLHAAFLVGADREAQVARLDGLLVGGENHAPTGERHALDAHEHPHDLTRSFSGSKSGVESLVATVTG